MYVDQSVDGLTPPAERIKGNDTPGYTAVANFTWHQYLKMSGAFDSDRPFWKDRNTKMTEFLESQRERKHICTLTNEESVNFTWNDDLATTFNPSQQSSDRLPDQLNGWTVFRNWKLLDGEDLIVDDENGVQDLEIQEAGIYELHFNVFFYASLFNYADAVGNNHFATREALDDAVSEFLHSNQNIRNPAAAHYGPIEDWEFSNTIDSFDGLFEDYTLLSDNALYQISLKWDVSNITVFTDMFKGDKKYGISAVLAINNAWGTSNPSNWSQTTAVLKTAPFETRAQLITAISGYPTSSAVYGTISTWLFDSGLTSFEGIFSNQDISTWDISTWDVQYVTNMKSMFEGANGLNQHDITGWDVSNVTDMSSMFKDCVDFDQNISSWNVSNVTDMSSMFEHCTDIPDGLRNNIHNWQNISPGISTVENVVNFADMFLNSGNWPVDTVVAINAAWGTANQTYWSQTTAQLLIAPFETRDQVIDAIDIWYAQPTTYQNTYGTMDAWEFKSTLTNFSGLFDRTVSGAGLTNFNEDISGWDTSNVTIMSSMFKGCSAFNQDINSVGNGWNVSSVTDMSSMFEGCSAFNQDISNWNVSSVTDMSSMFEGCSAFNQDISNWDVSGIGDTAAEATELYSIDYQVPASTDESRNPGSSPPSGYKIEYLLHNHSDNTGYWNIVNPQLTLGQSTYTFSNAVLTAPNLKDGLTNPKLISDIDFTINDVDVADRKYYRSYSAVQHISSNLYSVGSDILFVSPYHIISSQYPNGNSANAATAGYDYNLPIQFKFTNLPRGSYKLRIFAQLTNNGQNVPNYTVYTLTASGQNETNDNGNSSVAYVTFDNLDFTTNSNEIGWSAHYNTNNSSHRSTVFGGVQLQRNYYVSKFKDMFKNSAWASASDTVKDQINDAWTGHNVRWYKNEAKLF
jgi:surface protein